MNQTVTPPEQRQPMTLIERFFKLRDVPPFDRLYDSELSLITEATVQRFYEPGHVILSSNKLLKALFIVVDGWLEDGEGRRLPQVFSPEYLLMGIPADGDMTASKERGAICLLISKGHFFTMLYECPVLTLGFSELHHGPEDQTDPKMPAVMT